jgi:hypothetical protein
MDGEIMDGETMDTGMDIIMDTGMDTMMGKITHGTMAGEADMACGDREEKWEI